MAAEDSEEHPTDGAEPWRARGWGAPLLLLAGVAIVLAVVVIAASSLLGDDHEPETATFVVPAGTAEDAAAGKAVDLMPPEVRLRVDDTIVVRNDDTETATVGPFTVRPGETLTQTFRSPVTLVGECTLSGTGEIKIIVT